MKNKSLVELSQKTSDQLLELYSTLDAPEPGEMQGEFDSALPIDRDYEFRNLFKRLGRGDWLGKAYKVTSADGLSGEGYNMWRLGNEEKRYLRFSWAFENSPYDGRPAIVMRYNSFKNDAGAVELIDEFRPLSKGVYIGLYYSRIALPPFTRYQQKESTLPEMFLLGGPAREWVGPDNEELETGNWAWHQRVVQLLSNPKWSRKPISRITSLAAKLI